MRTIHKATSGGTDGRDGHTIGLFSSPAVAAAAAKGQGVSGFGNGDVYDLVVFDTIAELHGERPQPTTCARGHDLEGTSVKVDVTGADDEPPRTYDLCAACARDLDRWMSDGARSLGTLRRAFFSESDDRDRFIGWVADNGGQTAPPEPSVDSSRPGNTIMGWYLTYTVPADIHVHVSRFKGVEA